MPRTQPLRKFPHLHPGHCSHHLHRIFVTMTTTLKHGALVLFGSGPGIGQHVASLFASRGLNHVILLSRNLSRLQDDAEAVRSSARPGSTIDTIAADLSETADLERALSQIEGKLEARSTFVETVLYNAARVGESKVLEFPVADFENDFKVFTFPQGGTADDLICLGLVR